MDSLILVNQAATSHTETPKPMHQSRFRLIFNAKTKYILQHWAMHRQCTTMHLLCGKVTIGPVKNAYLKICIKTHMI